MKDDWRFTWYSMTLAFIQSDAHYLYSKLPWWKKRWDGGLAYTLKNMDRYCDEIRTELFRLNEEIEASE